MSLPPNYNPNDSLLSGGDTAKIIPVQGGGSMPGGTYNADASLLSGGDNAKLIPVQGGGDPPSDKPPSGNNIDNLDVYVLSEDEELPSPEEASEIATEEAGNPKEKEEPKALEVPCPQLEEEELDELAESFEGDIETADSKAKEVIRLVSKEFYIRMPKSNKEDDSIMSDWLEGKYTEDEAEFLNTMGLSPRLLYSSFFCHDKDWKKELANFLYYLAIFQCYPASSLLLRGECQQVREFLMIVESNLKAEQLRKLADKPVPVAGPIDLPELKEKEDDEDEENEVEEEASHTVILDRLKNLSVDKAKTEETKSIAKKITDFFKSIKPPSFFKSKKERLMNTVLDEIMRLEGEGKLNSNLTITNEDLTGEEETSVNETLDEEELKKQREEKIRQLKIKKFLESLPPKYRNMDLSIFIEKMAAKK